MKEINKIYINYIYFFNIHNYSYIIDKTLDLLELNMLHKDLKVILNINLNEKYN